MIKKSKRVSPKLAQLISLQMEKTSHLTTSKETARKLKCEFDGEKE